MTQHTVGYAPRRGFAEPITPAELNRLRHPRSSRIVAIARIVFVLAFVTILVATFLALRVVGSA